MRISDPKFKLLPEDIQEDILKKVGDRGDEYEVITDESSDDEVYNYIHSILGSLDRLQALGIISMLLDMAIAIDMPRPPKEEAARAQLVIVLKSLESVQKSLAEEAEERKKEAEMSAFHNASSGATN